MTSLDRISPLVERFRVRARQFHTGPLCGVTTFAARPGRGFLHILRAGAMEVSHQEPGGGWARLWIEEPTLLLYPRPLEHAFHHAPADGSDFACATLDFDGGVDHPLVRTLPPVLVVPLAQVAALGPALDLLYVEVDGARCGAKVLTDRLFEVVLIQLFRWLLDHPAEVGLHGGVIAGLSDPRLAPVLVAIHEDPGAEWDLPAMARVANLSRSSFAARFKDRVGQGPGDYVTGWRMVVARERLRGGASVARTAAELGYSSPAAFSRAFAARIGCSPRAWLVGQRDPEATPVR